MKILYRIVPVLRNNLLALNRNLVPVKNLVNLEHIHLSHERKMKVNLDEWGLERLEIVIPRIPNQNKDDKT